MTELKWTRDSTFHDGGRNFRARGPGVYDVPEDAVEEYLDHRSGAWERVDEDDTEEATDDAAESDGQSETANADSAEDATTDDASESEEAEAPSEYWWVSSDGESFDPDAWLDKGYEARVDAVQSGVVDAHLDAIEEHDTSKNVLNAVETRREE